MLRICHVNLAKGFRGGERQTELLIRYLESRTDVQYLVCRKNSPLIEHLRDVKNLTIVEVSGRCGGHFSGINADFVQAHEGKAVHWAYLEKVIHRTPYLITRRVPQPIKNSFFTNLCYKTASAVVAISSSIADYLTKRGMQRIVTINSALAHMNYDEHEAQKLKEQYRDYYVVGHIGAYVDRHKGQRVIIDAARKLQSEHPNIIFLLLGAGIDEEILKKESADLHNVIWLGFHKNVGDYLKIFDLFVFPSRNEGLGSVLLDVMDYGVPVIASDVDGIPDIVKNNETGILIENGNSEQLAGVIIKLASEPELARDLASNAKRNMANFSPESMAQKYEELYEKLNKETE